jgi:hypothetical protein
VVRADLEQAILDLASGFASPEELRDHVGLSLAEKIEIMHRDAAKSPSRKACPAAKACDAYVAYRMYATDCLAPTAVEAIVVVVIPLVYLALAYLTFRSQP